VIAFVTHYDVEALTSVAEPITGLLGLPGAAVPVIAVTLSTTAGAVTLAGTAEGIFTLRTAVASLLIGGILSFAVSTFRRSIPFQYGIWGAEFGTKVIAVNTALKLLLFIDHSRAVARAGVVRLRGFINTTCGGVCLRERPPSTVASSPREVAGA